jgi:hypothetical protein
LGGTPKRTAVPPPARGAAAKTRAARTKRGQRPTRPRRAWGQGGAVAGAMAPAMATALVVRILSFRPAPGGKRKRTAFSPPARNAATKTRAACTKRGQRPPVADVQAGRARAEGFLAPGGPGVSLALWEGGWTLPG